MVGRPTSVGCIDENTIGELFDHRLSRERVTEIDAHVSRCSECRDLLCGLARLYGSSTPSRALVQTANLLDVRALASSRAGEPAGTGAAGSALHRAADEANIKRLLALLGCEKRLGRVLAQKWRLDAVLGMGGMAEVYSATHLTNGRRAAIKLLRSEWVSRPNVVYRFLREGQVANKIAHPGAVEILDDGTSEDGMPFLVLELLEGRTIASHVRDRLPVRAVLRIASGILDVLAAAHDKKIVHRDIKPENIFLTKDGTVKVLDFGIARMRELTADSLSNADATQQGMMLGTPAYMPPEQAKGRNDQVDARTDIWAVGATMFALLAGRTVHGGSNGNETVAAAITKHAPKLATVVPGLSVEICAIVDRALAFDREDRWPAALLMKAAIDDLLPRLEVAELVADRPSKTVGRDGTMSVRTLAAEGSKETPAEGWALGASGASSGSPTDTPTRSEGPPSKGPSRRGGRAALGVALFVAAAMIGFFVVRSSGHDTADTAPSSETTVSSAIVPTPPVPVTSAPPPAKTAAEPAPAIVAEPPRVDDARTSSSASSAPRAKGGRRPATPVRRAEPSALPAPEKTEKAPPAPPPPPPEDHPLDRRD